MPDGRSSGPPSLSSSTKSLQTGLDAVCAAAPSPAAAYGLPEPAHGIGGEARLRPNDGPAVAERVNQRARRLPNLSA